MQLNKQSKAKQSKAKQSILNPKAFLIVHQIFLLLGNPIDKASSSGKNVETTLL